MRINLLIESLTFYRLRLDEYLVAVALSCKVLGREVVNHEVPSRKVLSRKMISSKSAHRDRAQLHHERPSIHLRIVEEVLSRCLL